MEKLDNAFCQCIVLYTHYFNFQFSYLHTFYKPNNIKTKPSTKVKSYFSINLNKLTDKYFTLDTPGKILSTKYYHRFIIQTEFSWF